MQVGSQKLAPGAFQKHLVARAHAKAGRRKSILVALSLTSMVDMFSLLVIFLLQSFSSSPEMMGITKGVELPTASSGAALVDAPVLSLTDTELFLDQKRVASIDELMKNPEPLMERLEALRELWQKTHPTEKFKGEINVQAHRNTPSTVVSQVMGLLPAQNFASIQLVVTSGSAQGR